MKVSGTNGINIAAGAIGMDAGIGGQADPVVKDLQNQIQGLQKQLKELSSNRELPPEMKSKKRQDIQKQITDLEAQLRQRQIEAKREEAAKKRQKDYSMDEMLGTKQQTKGAGKESAGMSAGSMEALISADATMKQADVHGSTAQKMEGRAGVLKAEIQMDSMSGAGSNISAKKEQLAEVEAKAAEATASQMGALAQATETAKKAAEAEDDRADRSEESEEQKADGADKTEQKADAPKDAAALADADEKAAGTDAAQQTGGQPQNTFDTAMLGVPFSRGRQTVDVKL